MGAFLWLWGGIGFGQVLTPSKLWFVHLPQSRSLLASVRRWQMPRIARIQPCYVLLSKLGALRHPLWVSLFVIWSWYGFGAGFDSVKTLVRSFEQNRCLRSGFPETKYEFWGFAIASIRRVQKFAHRAKIQPLPLNWCLFLWLWRGIGFGQPLIQHSVLIPFRLSTDSINNKL